jgi:UDP:flavonoid glycosyltransferase YjiC (YdhE family)
LKPAEDAQRRALGLPKATVRAVRRIVGSGALEIQAYDAVLFPGLNAQWGPSRPLVGAMTLGLSTNEDLDTAAWIAAGTPPIYFGFGSMLVDSPRDAIAMITDVCAELGERALICSGTWDLTELPQVGRVRVVRSLNHAAAFPQCRAVVHHGGAGTTAAGLRAAVPSLILWVGADQPIWGARIERLKAGRSLRFSKVTRESLLAALRDVLTTQCAAHARDVSSRMTDPVTSVTTTADLLEGAVRRGRVTLIR